MNREEASRPQRVNVKGSEIAFAATGIVTNNLERHRAGPDKPGQIAYRFDDDFAEVRRRLVAAPAQLPHPVDPLRRGGPGARRRQAVRRIARRSPRSRTASISSSATTRTSCAASRSPGDSLIFYGLGNFLHHGTADMTGKGVCRDYGLMARVHLKKAARTASSTLRARRGDPRHRHALPPAAADRRGGRRAHPRAQLSRLPILERRARRALHAAAERQRALLRRRAPTRTAAASARCARATRRRRRSPTTS